MPLRWRVRTLMVAVAIAGIALGYEAMRRRRAEFTRRVAGHFQVFDDLHRKPAVVAQMLRGEAATREEMAGYRAKMARYHDEMRLKYERAALYPWLPVSPDPPPPKWPTYWINIHVNR